MWHLEIGMQKHEKTKGTIEFLRTELEAAMTFVAIARHAKHDEKIIRNIANALKACESTRYFVDRVQLSEDEAAEIGGKLAGVEKELAALEESVRRKREQAAD